MASRLVFMTTVTVCLLIATCSGADVLIADTFTLNDADRQAGMSLTGTSPEVGIGTWNADGTWKFDAGGVVKNTSGSSDAIVPFATDLDVISMEVAFDFAGNTSSSYAMVGLSDVYMSQPYNWAVWCFVRGNGEWSLRLDTTTIDGGTGLDTSAGFHPLIVTLDKAAESITVAYDGSVIADSVPAAGLPALSKAGFGTSIVGLSVDAFTVTATPEPTSVALLVGGVAMCLRRRRD